LKVLRRIFSGVVLTAIYIAYLWISAEFQNPGEQWYGKTTGCELQVCGFVTPIIYSAAAMGVILLGWFWLQLAGVVTSIAKLLGDKGLDTDVKQKVDLFYPLKIKKLNALCMEFDRRLGDCVLSIEQHRRQNEEMQIQLRLSQRREKNIEAIIYSIHDAVIVIDEADRLLMANEAAGLLFGFDFNNSKFKPVRELIGADKSEFLDILSHSRKSKVQAARHDIVLSRDGSQRTFDCIVSCIYDQNQQAAGAVAVLHDITREKEISKQKDDFVSHVSHELKTPLASITAYSEMLTDGEADDEKTRKEFYSVIQSQATRLNRLIDDILNTSRIESGLIKINKEPVSLTILIEEQLQMIKNYAEEKNITVIGQKPIVFDRVYVDKDMFSQVIINLLSNAIKYTPAGGTVRIETEVDCVAGLARVRVIDTGVGIPQNEIEHVFDKYYRVDANKKQAKGTGLGLSLVKQIIEKLHNGRVFVTSKPGQGSTFGFELPLAVEQPVGAA
jgi:two-component system, OmpR family, phosphate regulon sensor histidine kinase PhoR